MRAPSFARAVVLALPLLSISLPALADIKIGVGVPLSGRLAAVGTQLRRGADQAVADINAKGGVLGQKLVVDAVDDGGEPTQSVAAANRLVTDRVAMVMGHMTTGTTMPAAQVYADEGVIVITPSSTSPELTAQGWDTLFRTCGRDDQQGQVIGAYLADHYKGGKIAIVDDQTTYGKGLADAVRATLKAKGVAVALNGTLTAGEKDFSSMVTRLKSADVDAVFYGGLYPEAGLLVRQSRTAGLKAAFLAGDTLASDEFWTTAGTMGEGVMMAYNADVRQSPAAKEALESFRKNGGEPNIFSLYSYAAVQVWAQAAAKAGSTDPKKVAAVLHSGQEFMTAVGPVSYDAKGDRKQNDYVIYAWHNGAYAPLAKP
ncbi:branched-chain amino acid ABC transporter substrate-binding protein [Nitrospirillum sp. BR 11828]|uniref:branched-chain amino acid ABC transporter substrate-binding protein n=1 Tax=Nitrospirillum sp. BR 11828 TaxID=3104325 RepID=UPI002ACAF189|nr:branched-chain amino acid ABC transporter substrate-binding protein [Nitrospirillum sp. BR 11828]MDZ5648472.1 branched-chain amino acid ABC transporter substrate-binding protein [Nitrospirillum sp. BR 11828]